MAEETQAAELRRQKQEKEEMINSAMYVDEKWKKELDVSTTKFLDTMQINAHLRVCDCSYVWLAEVQR